MGLVQVLQVVKPMVKVVAGIPWEDFRGRDRQQDLPRIVRVTTDPPPPAQPLPPAVPAAPTPAAAAAPAQPAPRIERPGCTAAENTIIVKGFLEGVAEGRRGAGVLALAPERLESAAKGAERMGARDVAEQLRAFGQEAASIRNQEEARAALAKLAPLEMQTWELGRRCGAGPDPRLRVRAEEIIREVTAGDLSQEQGVAQIREALEAPAERG